MLLELTEQELARRRLTGVDRWDETWEGVLHMPPAPTYEQQRIVDAPIAFFVPHLKRTGRGVIRAGINVIRQDAPREDYRIPDLTFVARGDEGIIAADGTRGGGPDAVIEVRSPGDETCEKLPFFAALGVREVVVADRDTKKPEAFRLAGPQYLAVAADREGRIPCEALGVRLRLTEGPPARLTVEDVADASARAEI